MAEKVDIIGGQLDGTVINNAASEATLLKLVEAVSKGGKGAAGSSVTADAIRIQQTYNRAHQDGYFEIGRFSRALANASGGFSDSIDDSRESAEKFSKSMGGGYNASQKFQDALGVAGTLAKAPFKMLGVAAAGVGLVFKGLGVASSGLMHTLDSALKVGMETKTPDMSALTNSIGRLNPVLATLLTVVDGDIKMFREFSKMGMDFGANINDFRRAAMVAGMSVDDFAAVLSEHRMSLALMGGSATAGATAFSDVSNQIQKKFAPVFSKLGMTMKETGQYTASYMDQMTQLGMSQTMTNDQLAAGAEDYIKELDMLSRVTGMTREEADRELKQQKEHMALKAAEMNMSPAVRKNLEMALAGVSDPKLKSTLTELVATGGVALSDSAKEMASMIPNISSLAAGLGKGSVTVDQFNAGLRSASTYAEDRIHGMGSAAGVMTAATGGYGDVLARLAGTFKNQGLGLTDELGRQKEAIASNTKGAAGFEQSLLELRQMMETMLLPIMTKVHAGFSFLLSSFGTGTPIFKFLASAANKVSIMLSGPLAKVGESLSQVGESFTEFFDTFKYNASDAIGDVLKSLMNAGAQIGISIYDALKDGVSEIDFDAIFSNMSKFGTGLYYVLADGLESIDYKAIGASIKASISKIFTAVSKSLANFDFKNVGEVLNSGTATVVELIKNGGTEFNGIMRDIFDSLGSGLLTTINSTIKGLSTIDYTEISNTVTNGFIDIIAVVGSGLTNVVSDFGEKFIAGLPELKENLSQLIDALYPALVSGTSNLLAAAIGYLPALMSGLISLLTVGLPPILEGIAALVYGTIQLIYDVFNSDNVKTAVGTVYDAMGTWMHEKWVVFTDWVVKSLTSVFTDLISGISLGVEAIKEVLSFDSLKSWFSGDEETKTEKSPKSEPRATPVAGATIPKTAADAKAPVSVNSTDATKNKEAPENATPPKAPIPGATIPENAVEKKAEPEKKVSELQAKLAEAEKKHAELAKNRLDEKGNIKPGKIEDVKAFEDAAVAVAQLREQVYAEKAGVKGGIPMTAVDKQKIEVQKLRDQVYDQRGVLTGDDATVQKWTDAKMKLTDLQIAAEKEAEAKKPVASATAPKPAEITTPEAKKTTERVVPDAKPVTPKPAEITTPVAPVIVPKPAEITTPTANIPSPVSASKTETTKADNKQTVGDQQDALVTAIKEGNDKLASETVNTNRLITQLNTSIDRLNAQIDRLIAIQVGNTDATNNVASAVKGSGNRIQ